MTDIWPREVRVWLTARQNLLATSEASAANALFFHKDDSGTELA
jgi:hypothetical protein